MENDNIEIVYLQQQNQLQQPSSSGYSTKKSVMNTHATPAVSGRWTNEEHDLFLRGLKLYNRQWKHIAEMIQTRTVVQIRTHAQKYFQKLSKNRPHDKRFDHKSALTLDTDTSPEVQGATKKPAISSSKHNNDSILIDFDLYWKVTDSGDNPVFVPVDISSLPFEWENISQQLKSATSCTNSNTTSTDSYFSDATSSSTKFAPSSLTSETDTSFEWNLGTDNERRHSSEAGAKTTAEIFNCDSIGSSCKTADESSDDDYFLGNNDHPVSTIKKRVTADMSSASKRRGRPKRKAIYSLQIENVCMNSAVSDEFKSVESEKCQLNSTAIGSDTNMLQDHHFDLTGCNSDDELLGNMIFESFAN